METKKKVIGLAVNADDMARITAALGTTAKMLMDTAETLEESCEAMRMMILFEKFVDACEHTKRNSEDEN